MFIQTLILYCSFSISVVLFLAPLASAEPVSGEECTGKLAAANQFPFAIRLYSKLGDSTVTYCTAAIITHSKLLTAGHCCQTRAWRFVVLGDPDQTDFVSAQNKRKYVVYHVSKVIIHPKFERTEDKLVYDLCILVLQEPMSSFDGHKTIEISYEVFEGKKNCTALGWGSTFGHEIQHRLYYKQAIGYRCNLRFGNSSKYWFVCLEPHSVCPGDSGGPLVCEGKLYGIASFFIGHGEESSPKCEEGVVDYYSALNDEREFIEKNSCVGQGGQESLLPGATFRNRGQGYQARSSQDLDLPQPLPAAFSSAFPTTLSFTPLVWGAFACFQIIGAWISR